MAFIRTSITNTLTSNVNIPTTVLKKMHDCILDELLSDTGLTINIISVFVKRSQDGKVLVRVPVISSFLLTHFTPELVKYHQIVELGRVNDILVDYVLSKVSDHPLIRQSIAGYDNIQTVDAIDIEFDRIGSTDETSIMTMIGIIEDIRSQTR